MSASTQTPTREAALALLLRQGEATAAQLAELLCVSVQVMRRHLRSLEDDGLVASSPSGEGPGRPSNHWHLTPAGHDQFPNGSDHFALGLLTSLADSLPADTVQTLLRQQAIAKALDYRRQIGTGSLPERLERLVELRCSEGYVSDCHPEPDGLSWCMSEFHCSVSRLAEQFPVLCDQELQQMRHTFPDCSVERVHWRLEAGHSCGFRITPDNGGSSQLSQDG
jgi:DeoR family suf operon transcriptional repressor